MYCSIYYCKLNLFFLGFGVFPAEMSAAAIEVDWAKFVFHKHCTFPEKQVPVLRCWGPLRVWGQEYSCLLCPNSSTKLCVQLTFPALLWSHNVLWCLMSSFSIHFHPLQEASYNADRIRHTTATGQREQNFLKAVNRLRVHVQLSVDPSHV